MHGGFTHGLGAALFEELAYDEQGNFLSGTFADYLCPTAAEIRKIDIGHVETRSPTNALGAKGMGDGSSMLTPAAIPECRLRRMRLGATIFRCRSL